MKSLVFCGVWESTLAISDANMPILKMALADSNSNAKSRPLTKFLVTMLLLSFVFYLFLACILLQAILFE
ncbi:MAG: hypothetical protein M3M88_05515 [Thermoproteota archaeon]|nr:hypothetical protein [Thermoproteota archaeon]